PGAFGRLAPWSDPSCLRLLTTFQKCPALSLRAHGARGSALVDPASLRARLLPERGGMPGVLRLPAIGPPRLLLESASSLRAERSFRVRRAARARGRSVDPLSRANVGAPCRGFGLFDLGLVRIRSGGDVHVR